MRVCVLACVCVFAYVCACERGDAALRPGRRRGVCVCVCMFVFVRACICVCVCVHACVCKREGVLWGGYGQ